MKQSSSVFYTMQLDNSQNRFIYSDEQLMSLFQEGDENAYIELVNRLTLYGIIPTSKVD